jgi:tetratricopeptide (TPR) repeat protein
MKEEDQEFLELLAYLYLQYGKHDSAGIIYHTLCELSEPTSLTRLAYAYCLACRGSYSTALHELEKIDKTVFGMQELSGFHLLRGNVFWHLRRDEEARKELDNFLGIERKRNRERSRVVRVGQSPSERTRGEKMESDNLITKPMTHLHEGVWKKFLRFIARKELNRELSR